MKICLVHHEYPEETSMGGIATYQRNMALGLTRLGHKVTVIAASLDVDKDYYEDNIHVIRFNKCIQYDTIDDMNNYRHRVALKLHELYLNGEIDVIESPEMGAECLMYLHLFHDVPVVCKLHTSFYIWSLYNKTTLPSDVHNLLVSWEREYIESADIVTSCTNLLYNLMKENNQIIRDDVIVLGNPIDPSKYEVVDNCSDNSILYLGGLEQRKGVLVLARAIGIVLDKFPDIKFKFIGNDTKSNDKNILTSEYIKSIVPSNYHKNLEFIPHVDSSSINHYCSLSTIGVVPSLFDNLPYVAMEEILSGLLVVASSNTGVSEMIDDSLGFCLFENENYVDLANKLITLYSDKDLRSKLLALERENIISKFSYKKICLDSLDIYCDAINRFKIKKYFGDNVSIDKLLNIGANFVYKIGFNNSFKVVKAYRDGVNYYDIYPIYYDRVGKFFVQSRNNKRNKSFIVMDYIDGVHKTNINNEEIECIVNFMNYYNYFIADSDYKIETLEDKISNFLVVKSKRGEFRYLSSFYNSNIMEIRSLFKHLKYCHGDLSSSNIIFSDRYCSFIDFDQTVFAPRYYDLAVFIIKFCNSSSFDIALATNIVNIYEDINGPVSENELLLTILLYLYKILVEKFYYEEMGFIDLDSDSQKVDYYLSYFLLFKKVYKYYLKKTGVIDFL